MNYNRRSIIAGTVMMLSVIELLNATMINIALPRVMSSVGANAAQVTWVLTTYIVASTIMMPLTGFLVSRIGQRRFIIIIIIGFLGSSILCGLSTTLFQLLFCRVLQGMFGAGFIPISQVVLRSIYSKEEQGRAMALWGVGLMIAPIFGPILGGCITQYMTWHWVFYINIPFCLLCLFFSWRFISETVAGKRAIDWLGLILMVIGIGCLQVFLDRGAQNNWFSSYLICLMLLLSVISLLIFIIRGIKNQNNIVNIKLFKDKNYALCTVILFVFSGAMFGSIVLLPVMLEKIFDYPIIFTGLILSPGGVASAITMLLTPRVMKRISPKILMILGIVFSGYGTYLLTKIAPTITSMDIIIPGVIRGVGVGLFFVPLLVKAYSTIPDTLTAEAAGLFSFSRMLGNAVGISLLTTIISNNVQVNWNILGGHVTRFMNIPGHMLAWAVSKLIVQSNLLAFLHCFQFATLIFLTLIPVVYLLFFLKRY